VLVAWSSWSLFFSVCPAFSSGFPLLYGFNKYSLRVSACLEGRVVDITDDIGLSTTIFILDAILEFSQIIGRLFITATDFVRRLAIAAFAWASKHVDIQFITGYQQGFMTQSGLCASIFMVDFQF